MRPSGGGRSSPRRIRERKRYFAGSSRCRCTSCVLTPPWCFVDVALDVVPAEDFRIGLHVLADERPGPSSSRSSPCGGPAPGSAWSSRRRGSGTPGSRIGEHRVVGGAAADGAEIVALPAGRCRLRHDQAASLGDDTPEPLHLAVDRLLRVLPAVGRRNGRIAASTSSASPSRSATHRARPTRPGRCRGSRATQGARIAGLHSAPPRTAPRAAPAPSPVRFWNSCAYTSRVTEVLRVTGEAGHGDRVGVRADQVADGGVPEVVEGQLLRALGVQARPVSAALSSARVFTLR